MNPHDGFGEDFGRDEDLDADMITMNPPRWQRWRPRRPVAIAGVAIVALAGGAGVGYAATHTLTAKGATDTVAVGAANSAASPGPAASAPASGPGARPGRRGLGGEFFFGGGALALGGLGGVLHGEVTVPKSGGGYQTMDVQDGTVTAVSSTSVTVKSADGFTASYAVTSKTVVDAQAAGIGSVKKGDTVFVVATVSGSTATAASITDVTAVKAGRASFKFPTPPAQPPSA
ncbi:hypothetical protein [Trebonia sp.]|uniref:hypothetical protein n=1 Tax=Trebonia sp. TaxID=2767075 RepID=UPI002605A2D1|nr:hypothetical protein [Trebonia sp.]